MFWVPVSTAGTSRRMCIWLAKTGWLTLG